MRMRFTPGSYEFEVEQEGSEKCKTMPHAWDASQDRLAWSERTSTAWAGHMEVAPMDHARDEQKVVVTLTRVRATSESGGETTSFDSGDPREDQDPLMAQVLGAAVGRPLVTFYSPAMKLVRTQGWEEMIERMLEPARDAEARTALQKIARQWIADPSQDWLTQLLPRRAVAPGATWTARVRHRDHPLVSGLREDFECHFVKLEEQDQGRLARC
jgi:hypothetical protein